MIMAYTHDSIIRDHIDNILWLISLKHSHGYQRAREIIEHVRKTSGDGWWTETLDAMEALCTKE